ncbi:hypothetical protein ASG94_03195 [Nocardioides sp. Soil805]|nr:hypothetical protein ASG94_03195 [Nocardioides sp. Soil805]
MASGLAAELVRVNPAAGAHRVAVRAAVSVAVPLLLLWSVDRVEWSIYAAFGAFTALYGRTHVHLSRLQMQAAAGALLVSVTVLGVVVGTSSHRAWLAVPVAGVVAAIGSLFSDAMDWHPPGPLFLVFAFAACASIPSHPVDVAVAAGVALASAAFAALIGYAGSAWRSIRVPGAPRTTWRRTAFRDVARRHLARNVGGVVLAGSISTAAGIGHPYWAMVSAVVPLAATRPSAQVVRGVHRVIGTFVGLAAAAVLLALDPGGLVLILVVVALQCAAELLVGRNYALALVAITPLALLMVHLAAPTPARVLLEDRGVETVIGVAVGLAIGYLTRDRSGPALRASSAG